MRKTKSCLFLCMQGLETFILPIVNRLSETTKVKLVLAGPKGWESQLSDHADYEVLWLEWANELAVTMTRDPQAAAILKGKKVVMRCHSYEVLSGLFQNVDLTKLNAVVFVAEHVKEVGMMLSTMKDSSRINDKLQIWTIPNGIDTKQFYSIDRERGGEIAFVGHISHKKGLPLMLHAFHSLPSYYRLHIAGEFQDYRFKFYADNLLKRFGDAVSSRVKFYGKVDNIQKFLEDKHFIVSSSPWEGHPVNIIEGMACGLKPAVHAFMGAEKMYKSEWVWTTIEDFSNIIQHGEYRSQDYSNYIHEKGWTLDSEIAYTLEMLDSLGDSEIEVSIDTKIEVETELDPNDVLSDKLKVKKDSLAISKSDTESIQNKFYPKTFETWPLYMKKAFSWILDHLVQATYLENSSLGIAVSSNTKKDIIYPEVTGYLIPTLLGLGETELSGLFTKCLVTSCQNQDGGFPGPGGGESIAFDSAQVLRGLLWAQQAGLDQSAIEPSALKKSIERTVDWLDSQLTEEGFIVKNLESYAMPEGRVTPQAVNLYSLTALIRAAMFTGQWSPKMDLKAEAATKFYLKDGLTFRDKNMLSHFFFYCIDGMIELASNFAWACGLDEHARQIILNETIFLPNSSFMIPAFADVPWMCSPGQSQAAICFWKLGLTRRFELAMNAIKTLQEPSGGFLGSYGIGNNWYFPTSEPSWAVKFFLDACLIEMSPNNKKETIDG